MATTLKDLIEDIEKDDLPTNEFTIEDEDPMVILGKINEVIASLKMIQATISVSDSKANEALQTSIQALETANQALTSSNVSLETANQAIATANQAIATANQALQESITANTNSNNAVNTANEAENNSLEAIRIAQEALDQVVQDLGTKTYINGILANRIDFDSDPQEQINTLKNSLLTLNNSINQLLADVAELGNELNQTANDLTNEITARQNADNELRTQINGIIDKIYPIGSIYMSVNSTSPQTLFGGTWEPLQNRFLIGASTTYSAGSTGGEATHTLTTNEMPSHTHVQNAHNHSQEPHRHTIYTARGDKNYGGRPNGNVYWGDNIAREHVSTFENAVNDPTTATNQNTGGGQAHNNMPPYLAVYMWKRTA